MTDNNADSSSLPPIVHSGQFKKGRKKKGGRTKGTPNINTEIHKGAMGRIRDAIVNSGGAIKTPAEFLVEVYNDSTNRMSDRVTAAKIVATIIHPNAPKTMNIKGGANSKVELTLLANDAHNNLERIINATNQQVIEDMNSAVEGEIIEDSDSED